ncbi:hypothetical protein SAMN05421854_102935 [Amycolatopsis rubida]|uniref:Uncharacterized protein n=1 Tax=Amycolatopsis rubida TaxID=112413 RepID=A0A1I5J518_9PSEU|nr:hypothetical protein SAMN05421854_102935 [Amycolatopsis rubida]
MGVGSKSALVTWASGASQGTAAGRTWASAVHFAGAPPRHCDLAVWALAVWALAVWALAVWAPAVRSGTASLGGAIWVGIVRRE